MIATFAFCIFMKCIHTQFTSFFLKQLSDDMKIDWKKRKFLRGLTWEACGCIVHIHVVDIINIITESRDYSLNGKFIL